MTEATRTLRTIVATTFLMLVPCTADASGGPMIGGGSRCAPQMSERFSLEIVSLEVDGTAVDPATPCAPTLGALYPDNAEYLWCGSDPTRHFYAKR